MDSKFADDPHPQHKATRKLMIWSMAFNVTGVLICAAAVYYVNFMKACH